jgi:pimeloyl-ACP methyl ester carboxylesterase
VHGFPDDHHVWDGVVEELGERFHVVTYDVRGAGGSAAPRGRRHFGLDQLEADLLTVVDAVSPGAPVHLVGHDWGSLQSWHAVTGDLLHGRLASYTSFCGTDLDHSGDWFRRRLRRPTRQGLGEVARQALHSQYISFFLLPLVPERVLTGPLGRRLFARLAAAEGLEPSWPSTTDVLGGLWLYRTNMPARLRRPRPSAARIPVQVVTASRDPYLTVALQTDVAQWVPDLTVHALEGGHWVPRSQPIAVAKLVAQFVDLQSVPAG